VLKVQRGAAAALPILLALCATLYLWPALSTPFYTKGEAREGLVVRRMVEQGDWVLPRRTSAEGVLIASKPPMFHWLGALAAEASGRASELAVRAPSLLLGTLTVLLVWLVGRTLFPPGTALTAAVVLATTFEWVRAASTARVDATLAGFTCAALLILYRGVVQGGLSVPAAIAAALGMAGATLTKGPVGFLLPALVLGVALVVQGRLRLLPRFRPFLVGAVVLAIVGAWYAAAAWRGGEAFVQKQILEENVFRFLGYGKVGRGHMHAVYTYVPALAAGFLPWTPLLVVALVGALRRADVRRESRVLFPLVWFAVVFVFYSAASVKRSVYLLALYPAAALLTAWWCAESGEGSRPASVRSLRIAQALVIAVGVAVAAQLGFLLTDTVASTELARLAPLLQTRDRSQLPLVHAITGAHRLALTVGLGIMAVALVVVYAALRQRRRSGLVAGVAVFATVLWMLVFGVVQPDLARARSLAPFLDRVAQLAEGRRVYFDARSFDFDAAFYAPANLRDEPMSDPPPPGPRLVLVWEDGVARLAAPGRPAPAVLATSTGTDPKGRRRLMLVRVD
jgi:4-amino-4-deoxy-L-arabinose transferase-like glycosyltransferase